MLTRNQVRNTVEILPEQFSIEQLIEKLLFMEKVEKGMEQSRQGKVIATEEVGQKLSQWLG
jgi:predicted transcriptional regulator